MQNRRERMTADTPQKGEILRDRQKNGRNICGFAENKYLCKPLRA